MTTDAPTPDAPTTSRTRRLLLPMAAMVAAAGIAIGSGASFTSTTSSAPNVVTAGDFTQTNSAEGSAIFTLDTAVPSDSATGEAKVTNTGDVAGAFTLVEEDATNTFPAGALNLVVTDTTDEENAEEIFSGDLGSLGSQPLGTIGTGESRDYTFVVTFASDAGNDAQGATASAVYTWNAVQAS